MATQLNIRSRPLPLVGGVSSLQERGFLLPTLYGIRRSFSVVLGLKEEQIEFNFTDSLKQIWKAREPQNSPIFKYPRIFIKLTSMEWQRERVASTAMTLRGVVPVTDPNQLNPGQVNVGPKLTPNKAVRIAYVYPCRISLELHYQHSDVMKLLATSELLMLLMAASNTLSFSVSIEQEFNYDVNISFDGSISVDPLELERTVDAGVAEIILPFRADTQVGFITEEAAVYEIGRPIEKAVAAAVNDFDYELPDAEHADDIFYGDDPNFPGEAIFPPNQFGRR